MKNPKLKKVNKIKYCSICKTDVEIAIVKREGYCPLCGVSLFSLDNRKRK